MEVAAKPPPKSQMQLMEENLEKMAATNKQQFAKIYKANKAKQYEERIAEFEKEKQEVLRRRE